METKIISHRRRRANKSSFNTEKQVTTAAPLSAVQTRLLAYELGSISRSKIQNEVSKSAPKLHRLVAHAAIYDNATRFILEDVHGINAKPMSSLPETTIDLDELDSKSNDQIRVDNSNTRSNEESDNLEITHHGSFNGYSQLKSHDGCAVLVTTTLIGEENSNCEVSDDQVCMEPAKYDSHEQKGWRYAQKDGRQSEWNFETSAATYDPHSDDALLWSQQPRVLSPAQANNLLIEAFG